MINTKMTSKNISINIKDNFSGTALTYACLHNSIEIVELLLKNECDLNIGRTINMYKHSFLYTLNDSIHKSQLLHHLLNIASLLHYMKMVALLFTFYYFWHLFRDSLFLSFFVIYKV